MLRKKSLVLLGMTAIVAAALVGFFSWDRTSSNAAGAFPELHLVVSGGGTLCSGTSPNVKCTANPDGTPFSVAIESNRGGTTPVVGGFQTETFFNGLIYTPKSCSVEITMEPEFLCLGPTIGAGGQASHGNVTGLLPPVPNWTNHPNFVSMPNVACPGAGTFALQLTVFDPADPDSSALGSKIKDASGGDITPKTALQDSVNFGAGPVAGVPLADKVVVNCGEPGPTDTPTPSGPTDTPGPPTATPTITNTPPPPTATPTRTNTPTPPPFDCGDVNKSGEVDSIDAALVLQFGAGLINTINPNTSDVNDSGEVDAIDAALILQLNAGLIDDGDLDCG
jgi:hypothetical protein